MANELTAPAPIDDDGSTVIQREAVISEKHAETIDEVERIYEVERTASVIASNSYTKVALQFPDELLADSTAVAHALTARTGAKMFILADTSYGSCCVDEVASEHYSAELIVHYGRTCLSLTTRIPVFYVFGKEPVDIDHLVAEAEKQLDGRRVLLMYDVPYAYVASEITQHLEAAKRFESVTCSTISVADRPYVPQRSENAEPAKPKKDCGTSCCGGCDKKADASDDGSKAAAAAAMEAEPTLDIKPGRSFELEPGTAIGDYTILYIGGESPTLTNIMLTQRCQAVFSYDPRATAMREETFKVNKHLNRRYFMVQKAKDADVIGIVVGTLAATRYLSVVESLKDMIRRAHKKFYVFVVGKLNVPKLANFAEIEVFVLVACPEHSLVDSKEFYRPIVTPYELQLALSHTREWTGDYVTEFHEFLALAEEEAKSEDGGESADEGDSEPHFSLITGTLRQSKRYDSPRDTAALESAGGADVALRNQNTQVAQFLGSAGAEHLLARSFRGLGHDDNEDFSVNKDDPEPMLAVEGRSGIARGYTHEKGL